MREIKFRGKLSHSGEWVIGNLIIAKNGNPYIIPSAIFEIDGHHLIIDSDSPFWVIPETVGQFTGLTDKNEKEIFEGDIVRGGIYLAYEVKWDNEECGWNIGQSVKSFEICGNIHDNPELIK